MCVDPQHRLLLEHTAHLHHTFPEGMSGDAAVIVGIVAGDYSKISSLLPLGNYTATGLFSSVAAGRYAAMPIPSLNTEFETLLQTLVYLYVGFLTFLVPRGPV